MNWFKENVFASVVMGITIVVVGALTFLCIQQAGALTQARADFDTEKGKYDGLIKEPIFPSKANLEKVKEQHKQYLDKAKVLKEDIGKLEQPLTALRPNQFQDKLNEAVRKVQAEAATNHVALPSETAKFHLGFPNYQAVLPSEAAVPELNLVLDVIKDAVDKAIALKVTSIDEVKRVPLPVEGGAAPAAATPPPSAGGAAGRRPAETKKVVDRSTFSISLTGEQRRVREYINQMLNTPQLVTIQLVRFENEQLKGPARTLAVAPPTDAPPVDPSAPPVDPSAAPAPGAEAQAINFVLGEEKVKATIRFQIIRLPEPTPAPKKS